MNPFVRAIDRLATWFNELPIWRNRCQVWGQDMGSSTFDRWLYLRLHRLGRMGGDEHALLGSLIRPGMTVIDVGANLGLYTVLLSRLVGPEGRVLAFEPDPALFADLRESCRRNGCTNVEPHNVALGSRRDRLVLKKMAFNSGDNHLGAGGGTAFRHEISVPVVPLDEFAPGLDPDIIKIDVQGWELEVLRGADKLLDSSPRCEVLLEYWPQGFVRAGYRASDLVSFIAGKGYRLHEAATRAPLDSPALARLAEELTGLRHLDLLAAREPGLSASNLSGYRRP